MYLPEFCSVNKTFLKKDQSVLLQVFLTENHEDLSPSLFVPPHPFSLSTIATNKSSRTVSRYKSP